MGMNIGFLLLSPSCFEFLLIFMALVSWEKGCHEKIGWVNNFKVDTYQQALRTLFRDKLWKTEWTNYISGESFSI